MNERLINYTKSLESLPIREEEQRVSMTDFVTSVYHEKDVKLHERQIQLDLQQLIKPEQTSAQNEDKSE